MRNTFLHFALPESADYLGAKHAVAVNSGTAAMHLALDAVGVRRGDEVITTTYTFAATAEVVRYFDARPVLVDIRADDFNINPELIEKAITEHNKAIIPVHIGGPNLYIIKELETYRKMGHASSSSSVFWANFARWPCGTFFSIFGP